MVSGAATRARHTKANPSSNLALIGIYGSLVKSSRCTHVYPLGRLYFKELRHIRACCSITRSRFFATLAASNGTATLAWSSFCHGCARLAKVLSVYRRHERVKDLETGAIR